MTPHPEALPLQVKLSGVRQQRGGGGKEFVLAGLGGKS